MPYSNPKPSETKNAVSHGNRSTSTTQYNVDTSSLEIYAVVWICRLTPLTDPFSNPNPMTVTF